MEQIIILGHGGHAKSVVDTIESGGKYKIAGYVVNEEVIERRVGDYPILGTDNELRSIFKKGITNAAVGIGYLGKGDIRIRVYNKLKEIGYNLPIIYDVSSNISPKVQIGEGTFIGKGSIVNRDAEIGKMCIINTGAIVEHDCKIDDFSHIAVGTILCGGVCVGTQTLVGANATVIQGRNIGDRCVVGAGEVVRKNIYNEV